MKPMTLTGGLLAAFLRGLFPATRQFDKQIVDIEREAVAAYVWERLEAEAGTHCRTCGHERLSHADAADCMEADCSCAWFVSRVTGEEQ